MRTGVALIALACLAGATADSRADEVVPEAEVSLLPDEELVQTRTAKEAVEVSAMDDLKAYCQVAAESRFYKNAKDKHKNALMEIIGEYSKDPESNKDKAGGSANNIVTQYGLMMGKLDGTHRGMYRYLLHALDDAILQGKSPFAYVTDSNEGEENKKPFIIFDYKLLGFQTAPRYFYKFRVSPVAWNSAKAAIPADQTAKAIAAKLTKDKKSFYNAALDRLVKETKAAQKAAFDGAVKDTHAAIHTAFTDAPDKLDNQEILHPMGQSGLKAALENDVYQNMPMPGMDALRKKALAEARTKVRAEAKKANASRLTKETEEKARLAEVEKKDKEKEQKDEVKKAEILKAAKTITWQNGALSHKINNWDQPATMNCGAREAIAGEYSEHNDAVEDRRFAYKCAKPKRTLPYTVRWTGWSTWDKPVHYDCSNWHGAGFISAIHSQHDNGREDRQFKVQCTFFAQGTTISDVKWTGWLNDWDRVVSYTCPHNKVYTGIKSVHDDGKEDRRFKVACGSLSAPLSESEKKTVLKAHGF